MTKKNFVCLVFGVTVLFLPLSPVLAQNYSEFNRFTDNVKLLFSKGDNKVKLALEIREKEVNSALENTQNGNTENAIKNLEKAQDKLKIVQEKASLNTSEEIKTSVEKIKEKINKDNLPEEFKKYKMEEEKTQLTAELTEKTFEYCKELAKKDFDAMLKEEQCNPKTAQPGLEKELKELKNLQEKLFTELMWNIRSCIDDPGTCNCEEVADIKDKAKCEKMVALAVRCEYKEDKTSCGELKAMEPKAGDNFAESFVPDFLMNLFTKKQSMIDYNIQKSDGVPPECWNWNNKPECKQYDYLKEWHYRSENNEERPGKPQEKEPTMQESVPECFDAKGNFLKEKCGEIIIVKNEKGLINYIVKNQIDNIVNEFENKSEQHETVINGKEGQNAINEIKEEINVIEGQIMERTFAPGTGPGEESGVVIKEDKQGVAIDNGGNNIIDNVVEGDENHVYAPGTTANGDNAGITIEQGGNNVVENVIDGGENEVKGVDEGPGEPGVIDED